MRTPDLALRLYGLFHLAEDEKNIMNVSVRDFQDHVRVFLAQARLLAKSLEKQGIAFTLLTNKAHVLKTLLPTQDVSLAIEEIPFITQVPSGITHYSAHFKLDAYRYLATLSQAYVGFCDIDMVCLRPMPEVLIHHLQNRIPLWYDISDQVIPAYGFETIKRGLDLIGGNSTEGRWAGGEFLMGPPVFFQTLMEIIAPMYDRYVAHLHTLHHVGDEALLSPALAQMRQQGMPMADAGLLRLVGRYWNTATRHKQPPFSAFQDVFLLHLPTDKRFLAQQADVPTFDPAQFLAAYTAYHDTKKANFRRFLAHLKRKILP